MSISLDMYECPGNDCTNPLAVKDGQYTETFQCSRCGSVVKWIDGRWFVVGNIKDKEGRSFNEWYAMTQVVEYTERLAVQERKHSPDASHLLVLRHVRDRAQQTIEAEQKKPYPDPINGVYQIDKWGNKP